MRPLLLVVFALVPGTVHAAVSYVDIMTQCAGLTPCYATIMDAVQDSIPPATIEVFPGVYHEAVTVVARGDIQLRPHGTGARPVIAAPALLSAVTIIDSPGFVLSGFIVESPDAAGVAVHGGGSSSVVLEANYIRSVQGVFFDSVSACVARDNIIDGGGLDLGGSRGCVVEGNTVHGRIAFDEGLGCGPRDNQVRSNVVLGAGIALSGRCASTNAIISNSLVGGGIEVSGSDATANLVRGNVVRGGGIALNRQVAVNTVEDNFVSDSPGSGILVAAWPGYGRNTIQRNTSVENAACDLDDASSPLSPANLWLANRYMTGCGAAAGAFRAGPPHASFMPIPPGRGATP
jgi:hypothetical protein